MDELRELMRRARAGDEGAFEEIVRLRRERAVYLAYQIVGDWEEARDAAQGAFVKVWQQLGTFDARYPFDAWFRRIVTNQAIDQLRKGRLQRATAEESFRMEPAARAQAPLSREEVQRLFEEAAAELPARERAVFVLREMEDMTPREIADDLGITESTVRNHLFKARRLLRRFLSERYPEYARPGSDKEP